MVSPGWISRLMPLIKSGRPGSVSAWRKCTFSNTKEPLPFVAAMAPTLSTMVLVTSITSKMRSKPLRASKVRANRKAIEAIGPARTAAVAKKAKSSPVVSSPTLANHTPRAKQLASAKSGIHPNQKPRVARVLPFSISRSLPREARVVKRARASGPRPKDLRMRIP